MRRLARFAWAILVYNILVILMGAVVRATGSGAGCGRSWPTCEGRIVPELTGDTAIEFAHRGLSGVALVLVAVLVVLVLRWVPAPNQARTTSVLSAVAIVVEALIGAVIVLFEWVADDASVARAVSVPLHLVSTFFLLAVLTLTAHLLDGGTPLRWSRHPTARRWLTAGAVAFIVVAATGAVTALADTLFPAFAENAVGVEHFLTDLRVVHPIVATVIVLIAGLALVRRGVGGPTVSLLSGLVGLQFVTGILLIALALPLWLRITHLALADVLWIGYVLAGATLLADPDKMPVGELPSSQT